MIACGHTDLMARNDHWVSADDPANRLKDVFLSRAGYEDVSSEYESKV